MAFQENRLQRLYIILLGLLTLAAFNWVDNANQPYTLKIAKQLLGERWYRINLENDHVGYMVTHAYIDTFGVRHFTTTTHFLLQQRPANTLTKHLEFSPNPPFALQKATYENRSGEQTATTRLLANALGFNATITRGRVENQLQLDWQYVLSDFLGFEHWLSSQQPQAGAERIVRSPDFERLRITSKNYRVLEKNTLGYVVETAAPLAATQTQLDHNMKPIQLNMAGLFTIVATDKADAIALSQMNNKTNYLFALDQRLIDHQKLRRLTLGVSQTPGNPLPKRIELLAGAVVSSGSGANSLGEELAYPISHPKIQALVQEALTRQEGSASIVDKLVNSSHRSIEYSEGYSAGSVIKALTTRQGECTDYADLFTTLARAAGLPAKTVYGLAYKDGAQPAFMFHAWNEVLEDGVWRAVDPTWNQLSVDATHLPLSTDLAASLMLAHSRLYHRTSPL